MSFGLVNGSLLCVLCKVGQRRGWSEEELKRVVAKLHKVELRTPYDVLLAARCGILNSKLKEHGEKGFGKETLRLLVAFIGLSTSVFALEASISKSLSFAYSPSRQSDPSVMEEEGVQKATEVEDDAECSVVCAVPVLSPTKDFDTETQALIEMEKSCLLEESQAEKAEEDCSYHLRDLQVLEPISDQAVWRVIQVPLWSLYFYQTTVAGTFSDGTPLQVTVDALRAGSETPETLPLMQCLVVSGMLYGMGTRRLLCFHRVYGNKEPDRPIPVLFCNRTCDGFSHNPEGKAMAVIGCLMLDNRVLTHFSREPSTFPPLSCLVLRQKYQENRLPYVHQGSREVFFEPKVPVDTSSSLDHPCAELDDRQGSP